ASAPMTPRRATIDRPASLSLVMAFLVPCGLCRDRWRTLEHHRRQMKPAFHTAAGAAGRRGRRFVKGTIELFTTFQVRCLISTTGSGKIPAHRRIGLTMAKSLPNQRIDSIDFWRGIVLLSIFINHIPGNVFEYLTHKNIGLSDAAEAFVFLSGVSVALR